MKKTKKLLCFFSIFLFVIILFSNISFAAENEIQFSNGQKYKLDLSNVNLKSNYFIVFNGKSTYYLFTWDSDTIFYASSSNRFLTSGGMFSGYMADGTTTFTQWVSSSSVTLGIPVSTYYSNVDIQSKDGSVTYYSRTGDFVKEEYPTFVTTKEILEAGNFDKLEINPNNYDVYNTFYFTIYEGIELDGQVINYYPKMDFKMNNFSDYYQPSTSDSYAPFLIPKVNLQIPFETGRHYMFVLRSSMEGDAKIYDRITFTVGERKTEEVIKDKQDETNSKLDEQNKKLDEQNETSKNIWESIKEVLSYINPFSENFFVYKLISLLIDAIKSLFIPSDDFFSNYFTNLKDWFSDRLGFLFYPFEIVIDILNKIANINFSDPVIHIPDINEPFTNKKLISSTTFDFNSLLSNSILKNIHDIYLIGVDVVIIIALVNLAKRKWEEVSTK